MKNFSLQTGMVLAVCFALTTCSYGQYRSYGAGGYGGGYGGYGGNYGGYGGYGSNPVRQILGYGYGGGYGGYGNWGWGGAYGGNGANLGPNSAIIPGSASNSEKIADEMLNPELARAKKFYTKHKPVETLSTYESTGYNWWNKVGNDAGVGYWQPGGASGRTGSPYFNSADIGGGPALDAGSSGSYSHGSSHHGYASNGVYGGSTIAMNDSYSRGGNSYSYGGGSGVGGGESGFQGGRGRSGGTYHGGRHVFSTHPDGLYNAGRDAWGHHFGPGYYRHSERSHYRFPYYSYRRPWYFQGPASKNRDTNLAW